MFKKLIFIALMCSALNSNAIVVLLKQIQCTDSFFQGPGGAIAKSCITLCDSFNSEINVETFDSGMNPDIENSIKEQSSKGLCFILAVVISSKAGFIWHDYYDGIKLNCDLFGNNYEQNKTQEILGDCVLEIEYYEISAYSFETSHASLICSYKDFFSSIPVRRDYVRAFLSAQQNIAPAQFKLANLFLESGNKEMALYWFQKAALQGHIVANFVLKVLSHFECNCNNLANIQFIESESEDGISDE